MFRRGKYEQAEPLLREALEIRRRHRGDRDPETATFLINWSTMVLHSRHDAASAEALMREALAIQRKFYGNDHPEVVDTLNRLSRILKSRNDMTGSEECTRESEAISSRLRTVSQTKGRAG